MLFILSAIYDGLLGLAFLVMPLSIYQWYAVTPPNHMGYVHFPAALLVVFAILFINIAVDPERYRHLIPYGVCLKLSYCLVVFWHWFTAGLPDLWKPFAIFDACFGLLFVWSYLYLDGQTRKRK